MPDLPMEAPFDDVFAFPKVQENGDPFKAARRLIEPLVVHGFTFRDIAGYLFCSIKLILSLSSASVFTLKMKA